MGEAAPADNGDVVVDVAPGLVAVQPPAEGLGAPSSFDWGDEMEESDRKDEERMVEIEAKIAAENEKARARAERFGVDFVEPKLEVILTREEIDIFRAVTKARQPLPDEDPQAAQQGRGERRRKGRRTDMDIMASDEIQGQVRDREYTEALLAKVAELHKAAKARAEKFGEEYVPPRLKVLLTPTEYRKYMSATAGRNPLDMEFAPVAGLDTTTEEERELQRKRASRFSAEGAEGAGEGGAEGAAGADDAMDADEEGKERARAAKFGLEVSAAPYGENVRKRFICERRDMEENAELVHDSVHCFGLDRFSAPRRPRFALRPPRGVRRKPLRHGLSHPAARLWGKAEHRGDHALLRRLCAELRALAQRLLRQRRLRRPRQRPPRLHHGPPCAPHPASPARPEMRRENRRRGRERERERTVGTAGRGGGLSRMPAPL